MSDFATWAWVASVGLLLGVLVTPPNDTWRGDSKAFDAGIGCGIALGCIFVAPLIYLVATHVSLVLR